MYLIYQGAELVERAEEIRYVKHQENGVKVLCEPKEHDMIYSPTTDKMYSVEMYHMKEQDETVEILDALLGVTE